MEIDVITGLITTVGFPIVVCGYLLIRQEKTIKEINETTAANTMATRELTVLISERLK